MSLHWQSTFERNKSDVQEDECAKSAACDVYILTTAAVQDTKEAQRSAASCKNKLIITKKCSSFRFKVCYRVDENSVVLDSARIVKQGKYLPLLVRRRCYSFARVKFR